MAVSVEELPGFIRSAIARVTFWSDSVELVLAENCNFIEKFSLSFDLQMSDFYITFNKYLHHFLLLGRLETYDQLL